MTGTTISEVLGRARSHAMARGALGFVDVDPDGEARQHLRALSTLNPAAGTAEGLLANVGGVVPLNPETLSPSREPFAGFTEALAHFVAHPRDGVGLLLGTQHDGSVRFAVRATAAGWARWLADVGTEEVLHYDEDGRVVESTRSYRVTPR